MYVITADQRSSRTHNDRVPAALTVIDRTGAGRLALPAERNAGDEVQALTASADAALDIALDLLRDEQWSVGIGVGAVEMPLPVEIRAARGPAFIHAREAVERAKGAPGRVAVTSDDIVASQDAEAFVRLLVELRDRRTPQGWEVADLLARGLTQKRAAGVLKISEAAVSLRAKAASLRVEEAALPALARLFALLDGGTT